jgi:hypothetical protein
MQPCPDCSSVPTGSVSRRQFVQTVSATAAAAIAAPTLLRAADDSARKSEPLVKKLYESLTPAQKEDIAFPWDYQDDRGLLRMHVSNNWQITDKKLASGFFNKDQQEMLEAIFWDLYSPDWHDRIRKQLKDDAGGYGKEQSIAFFGAPGTGTFEMVMTGRHLTIRCDGDCVPHTAFGGPIFYGHAAEDFNEKPNHPGNVYWHQALLANDLFKMLDGKQRDVALIAQAPKESNVHFRGKSPELPGLPVSELSADQKTHAQKVLAALVEPYRQVDKDEIQKCLAAQGGYDQCRISFYQSGDLGDDKVWDIWRIEGPSFVWHYRGAPHVHVFVNVADDPSVKITARG